MNRVLNNIKNKIDKELTGIEKRDDLSRDEKVSRIIKTFSTICAATAAQPLPFADTLILTPIQIYMGERISAVHGLPLHEASAADLLKEISAAVGMGLAAQQIALGLYKC